MIRGAMFCTGPGLMSWGLLAAFVTPWFWAVIILGALVTIAAGLAEHLLKPAPADDDGYAETVFGIDEPIEHASHWRAWERELAGTWDFQNGAPE